MNRGTEVIDISDDEDIRVVIEIPDTPPPKPKSHAPSLITQPSFGGQASQSSGGYTSRSSPLLYPPESQFVNEQLDFDFGESILFPSRDKGKQKAAPAPSLRLFIPEEEDDMDASGGSNRDCEPSNNDLFQQILASRTSKQANPLLQSHRNQPASDARGTPSRLASQEVITIDDEDDGEPATIAPGRKRSRTPDSDSSESDVDAWMNIPPAGTAAKKRKSTTSATNERFSDIGNIVDQTTAPATGAPKRKRRTVEEIQQVKARKELEKQQKKEEKEEQKRQKEKQKAQSKQLRDSNKRPDDKKATLRDTYIDLGRGLHMIYAHDLKDVLSEHDAGSNVNEISIPQLSDIRNLVLWRRKVTSKFNEDEKFFEPLLPGEVGIKVVGAYMLYFEPQSLQKLATAKALFQTVVNLQSIVHRIESIRPPHIFVMVNNSTGWNKIKERKRLRRLMEEAYVQLSLEMGVNVIQCEAEEQVVNWIFNLSGDLGVREHKLWERSLLPVAPVKPKEDDKSLYIRMLAQIPGIGLPEANAIARFAPCLDDLYEKYSSCVTDAERGLLLCDIEVLETKSGASRKRNRFGDVRSRRVAEVLWSTEARAIVNTANR